MFGGDSELFKNELYTFANIVVPSALERIVNSAVIKNVNELKTELKSLKGSGKLDKKLHLC